MEKVIIRTATVGQHFGTVGIVERINPGRGRKRRVHTTDVYGYGHDGAARRIASDWAETRGFEVLS